MDELDRALGRLRAAPAPDRLAQIDAEVLASIRGQSAHGAGFSNASFALVAVAALFVGIIGSSIAQPGVARTPIAPFGAPSALAASTLLAEAP